MLKRIFLGLAALLGLLVAVLLVRTLTFTSKQAKVEAVKIEIDAKKVAARLSQSVVFKTISYQDPKQFQAKPFLDFNAFLKAAFPKTHAALKLEVVGKYSLLYTWKGSDASLKPLLLMGHTDVVPVSKGTEKDWKHPPFSGKIADGAIWGRGTLDDKVAVLGALEGVEWLLHKGFKPKRTVYLAFGHDEEIGGRDGAKKIAQLLQKRGVKLECVIDEGMAITHGIMPGVKAPVALIGIAEKGYLTVKLSVKGAGGHSSMPPKHTAAGLLGRAVARVEKHPMPARIQGVTGQMFAHVGPEMGFGNRLAIANMWLFRGILKGMLSKKNSTNATIRTTTAVTVLRSGVKENVLPASATAMINFRILPGDAIKDVLAHVKRVIDDPRVKVEENKAGLHKEPSPISDPKSPSFGVLQKTIRQLNPGTVVTPGLVVGGTDSRHYSKLTPSIYRFLPISVRSKDLKRIHGTNERITVENYAQVVRFYIQIIRNMDGLAGK